jgi:predicted RNA polymerase sigma factor
VNDAYIAAENVARQSYGQLLATLAYRWRDIAAAEDALAEALAIALRRWPEDGIPASPAGWLMTVAHRQMLMVARRQRLADDPALTVLFPTEAASDESADQPWWAAYADLLARAGKGDAAAHAYGRAAALSLDPAVRQWLSDQRHKLVNSAGKSHPRH